MECGRLARFFKGFAGMLPTLHGFAITSIEHE